MQKRLNHTGIRHGEEKTSHRLSLSLRSWRVAINLLMSPPTVLECATSLWHVFRARSTCTIILSFCHSPQYINPSRCHGHCNSYTLSFNYFLSVLYFLQFIITCSAFQKNYTHHIYLTHILPSKEFNLSLEMITSTFLHLWNLSCLWNSECCDNICL